MRPTLLAAGIALASLFVTDVAFAAPKPAVKAAAPSAPAWVEQSNAQAKVLIDTLARFQPEFAGRFGVSGLDTQVTDLKPGINERARQALEAAAATLRAQREKTTEPKPR